MPMIAQTLQAAGFDVVGVRDLIRTRCGARSGILSPSNLAAGPDTVAFV